MLIAALGFPNLMLVAGCAARSETGSEASSLEARHPPPPRAARAVAVTFDDLPVAGGGCDGESIRDVNRRLLAHLAARAVPAAAFVNEGHVCDELRPTVLPEILGMWLDAGHDLGNHTFSHPDLNRTPLEDYFEDVDRGAGAVARALEARGRRLRYFRHPFLRTGSTPETKQAVDRFLAGRGYVVAPVTIDNQEWVFARAYARARARGDAAEMRRVAEGYVPFMKEVVAFFEVRAREVVGREIPQILLVHANELNADHFDRVADMLRRRGYRFISLDEALRDPAYGQPDTYVGRRGISWLHRWAAGKGLEPKEEPREPGWLQQLAGL